MSARRKEMQALGSHRLSGFSLIELMVALVLGLLVAGAALAILQSNQATYRSNEGLNRVQENARIAFELMSRDIRAAGGTACSNFSVVEGASTEANTFRTAPVTGSATQLQVISGDDTAYRVVSSTSSSVTLDPDELETAEDAFDVGDVLLLCNARKTHLVRADSVGGMTVGFAALPENYNPTEDEFAPPAAVVLSRLRDVQWFVAANGRGGSSLFVSRSGGPREEVAEGIQDLAFEYLEAGNNAYSAAPGNWIDVIAVRITMTLAGQDIDGEAFTRQASNVVSMRGRTL
ncbi:MAG: prepilin-type N-terminal cleavage/methylation domain-containing protein [Pseudoxanthomonas sp.]|nr:prepilin-type N-terminal cleavage/methylation domain-containing protein [Pseudoxanthomonas sp.]